MQFLKQISSTVLHSVAPLVRSTTLAQSPLLSQAKCVSFTPVSFNLLRNFSVTPSPHLHTSPLMEQKKKQKLYAHMYGGGDNGGVDYG